MANKPYLDYQTSSRRRSSSRRELRELREEQRREERRKKWGERARTMSRLLIGSSKKKQQQAATLQSLREETQQHLELLPKSRRQRRERNDQRRRQRQLGKWRGGVVELALTILVAVVLVFGVVRPFVVAAYKIPSTSMVPTLEVGDRILANKLLYTFSRAQKGDMVVFESVEEGEEQTLIKRVVGEERDKVEVRDGTLYINDVAQEEEAYLNERMSPQENFGAVRVPRDHIFVMGDNRNNSADSRVFGPLPLENVEGKAFVRFWPIPKIGPLTSSSSIQTSSE